jgi:hypothetical protein
MLVPASVRNTKTSIVRNALRLAAALLRNTARLLASVLRLNDLYAWDFKP